MKKSFLCIIIVIIIIILCIISWNIYTIYDNRQFRVGKSITLVVEEDEVIDSKYVKEVIAGERDESPLSRMEKTELKKLRKYLRKNNYKISPGAYEFNKAWRFKDGYFIYGLNGFKEKVFQFEPK